MEIGHHQSQGSGLCKLSEWVKSALFGHIQRFLTQCLPCASGNGQHSGGRRRLVRSDGPEVQALLGCLLATLEDHSLEL